MSKPLLKVLALLGITVFLGGIFLSMAGFEIASTQKIQVNYNFAGGISEGSVVRVSGIKVGEVEKIEFNDLNKKEHALTLTLKIKSKAFGSIREDSNFYINLAGLIGDRYIEITPGKRTPAKENQVFIGIDPPRIDQLISQSFNLAGKIAEVVEANKGDLQKTLKLIFNLSAEFNEMFESAEKNKLFSKLPKTLDEILSLTIKLNQISEKALSKDSEKTLKILIKLIERIENLDEKKLRDFLQEEGIRARIF